MSLFDHEHHPHVDARQEIGPAKVADHAGGVNGRIALRLTALVGTMGAAYTFAALALIALPSTLGLSWLPARTLLIVSWISQTMIQLVMLAVLQLGQNLQAHAADRRSEMTFLDAEAILHESHEIHAHLEAQDAVLRALTAAASGQPPDMGQNHTIRFPPGGTGGDDHAAGTTG